jgi:hypothetical protein
VKGFASRGVVRDEPDGMYRHGLLPGLPRETGRSPLFSNFFSEIRTARNSIRESARDDFR